MKIVADRGKCEGYANCIVAAPDYFDLDDEYIVLVLAEDVPDDSRAQVEEAIRNCPVHAISMVEE